jgi:hypothetical protein
MVKLTKKIINNNLTKLCLEIIGHQTSTLIPQYVNVCLHLAPHSTLNVKFERLLEQFHKIAISTDSPEGILHADE